MLQSYKEIRAKQNDSHARVEVARFYAKTSLDVSKLSLTEIPVEAYQLTQLESLYASHNQFEASVEEPHISISPQLSNLRLLTILDLGWNNLKIVPAAIYQLTNLESLVLNNNQLQAIDPSISNLQKLKTLHLGANLLTELPETIGQLDSLESLIAPTNMISILPDSMATMKSLLDIYLRYNKFAQIPSVLAKIPTLTIISIEDNNITSLPQDNSNGAHSAVIYHSVPLEVIPQVFIGTASTAQNPKSLELLGITHQICLTDPLGESPVTTTTCNTLKEVLQIQIADVEIQDISNTVRRCNSFLETAISQGKKILVNSTLGTSRSAAIIIAYMMKNLKMSYEEALSKVRQVRKNARPNPGFEAQLRA